MVADGAQGEKALAEAWLGASDCKQIRVAHHPDGWDQKERVYLKPTLTLVALRRKRAASSVKQHPQPVQARRSKPDLSECSLVAGNEPAKSQLMPSTCSRVAAADGSDIARRRGSL